MRHIDEVLRLAAQGLSQHEISTSVGISRTSVHNYLERARQAGLSWPLPEDLDAAGLEARLFKRTDEGIRSDRPEPNWLEVHHEHKRGKHVTRQLLHLEYKAINPDGWGYTQFCSYYRRWLGRHDVASWLDAHVRALEFYGGSVRLVVPDNLKSGVTKSCWYEPGLNASYQELARWYSLGILPARPYRPKDKGALEAGVQVAEHWILAPLRKRRFFSLGQLNVAIAEQVRLVNERPFCGQTLSRRALFDELERGALQPLPLTRYEIALWKPAKVNIEHATPPGTWLSGLPGPQTLGQALRSRAHERSLPAGAGDARDLVRQRAGHFEEQSGPGTGRRRSIGQGGAHPPYQSARGRLLPADAGTAGGLSHADQPDARQARRAGLIRHGAGSARTTRAKPISELEF